MKNKRNRTNLMEDMEIFNGCYMRAVCYTCLSHVSFCPLDLPIFDGRIYVNRTRRYKDIQVESFLKLKNFMVMDFVRRNLVHITPESLISFDESQSRLIDFHQSVGEKILPRVGMTQRFLKDVCKCVFQPDFCWIDSSIKIRPMIYDYKSDLSDQPVMLNTADTWRSAKFSLDKECRQNGHKLVNANRDNERKCSRCHMKYGRNLTDQMFRTRKYADYFIIGGLIKIFSAD